MTNIITSGQAEDTKPVEELIANYESSLIDVAKKMNTARVNFFNKLKVTAQKYRMVTGVDHILQMLIERATNSESKIGGGELENSSELSHIIADRIENFARGINIDDSFEDIGTSAENLFVNKNYIADRGIFGVVEELINIELMQQIGDVCDQVINFEKIAFDELDKQIEVIQEKNKDYTPSKETVDEIDKINKESKEEIETILEELND